MGAGCGVWIRSWEQGVRLGIRSWGICGEVCEVRYLRWDTQGEIYMRWDM